MNVTQKSDLLDEMIEELDRARTTKQTQMGYISDICDKTNNILLQIEASQKAKVPQKGSTGTRCKYHKETLHALARMIETFDRLLNNQNTAHQSEDFETYTTSTKAKIDVLGSGVRKLLALNDTVNQIGSELHQDTDDFYLGSSDTSDPNSSK